MTVKRMQVSNTNQCKDNTLNEEKFIELIQNAIKKREQFIIQKNEIEIMVNPKLQRHYKIAHLSQVGFDVFKIEIYSQKVGVICSWKETTKLSRIQ